MTSAGDAARAPVAYSAAGATDLHVHCGPEGIPRRFDAVQLAEHVAASGLRSLVLKSHFGASGDWAQIAHRLTGVRLAGSITLNHHVGGINPMAVRAALGPADDRGPFLKVVWLPTVHSGAHLAARRTEGEGYDIPAEWAGGVLPRVAQAIDTVPPISLLAAEVQPRLDDVLRLIAEHRLVLATGHIGRDEVFHVVERAHVAGVERIVATHVLYDPPAMTRAEMRTLAAAGVHIELTYVMVEMGLVSVAEVAGVLAEIGPDRVVLTTDLGQVDRRAPADGMAEFGRLLLEHGVPLAMVDAAMKTNPAALLS